jgi:RecA-family ATPase
MAKGLHVLNLTDTDAVMAAPKRNFGPLEPTALYHRILEMASDLRPVITTISSAAIMFGGNENDRAHVQQFVHMLTRIATASNGAVVLVSHPSLSGISSDSGLSGSTQWHNAVRARYFIKGVKKDEKGEPTTNRRIIQFRKNNYGPISNELLVEFRNGVFVPVAGGSIDQAAYFAKTGQQFR